jgi:hypothetical protein
MSRRVFCSVLGFHFLWNSSAVEEGEAEEGEEERFWSSFAKEGCETISSKEA